jgi:hypothetical protein
MSDEARENFVASKSQRRGQNDARRIQGERDKARSPSGDAARRWPFELLQNAHDPGPRGGESVVNVEFSRSDSLITFRHNGCPFSSDDLAALVSGGSNKEYESAETTGRYGTGFLVTHVLSSEIRLSGILEVPPHLERFRIRLDRSGDASAILSNAEAAELEIAASACIESCNGQWTAEFEYPFDNPDAVDEGVQAIHGSTPFLFGTCEHLGQVTIDKGTGSPETWTPEAARRFRYGDVNVLERCVALRADGTTTQYRVLRMSSDTPSDVGIVILLRFDTDAWGFVAPRADLPRIFARLPIRGSTFLPINFIVDGKFNAQQERDRIAMDDGDKARLSAAISLISPAIKLATEERWRGWHWMCRAAVINKGFSENPLELNFWNGELRRIAGQLAEMPLVETRRGYVPAAKNSQGHYADFMVPRYSRESQRDEVAISRVWELADRTTVLDPPVGELVSDWSGLSSGWESLGISVTRRGLKEIAEKMREAKCLRDLPVKADPLAWLARFLNTLGELPPGHDCSALMHGLLPDQRGGLSNAASLRFDAGIPEELKDLAEAVGHMVRDRILDSALAQLDAGDGYPFLREVLKQHITEELTEETVLKGCIDHLSSELPEGKGANEDTQLVRGSVNLLGYIWMMHGTKGAASARNCPLLTRADSIARHTSKKIMAPVAAWHEAARPFAGIYVPSRVLADVYCEWSQEGRNLVKALVEWGIAYPDPLIRDQRKEIDEKLLREMVPGGVDVRGVKVKDEEFSRVALLETEVIQHCEDEPELASLLFAFALKYLAPHDSSWRATRNVIGRRGGEEVPLRDTRCNLARRPEVPCMDSDA